MKLPLAARFAGLTVAFGLCAALLPSTAGATTSATNPLTVNASVAQICTIGTATITFTGYDPVTANAAGGANLTSSTGLTVHCSKGSSGVTVTADTGNNGNSSGACSTTRSMKSGSDVLCYDLFTDAGFTNVWDSGVTNYFSPTFTTNTSPDTAITVYGSVPKGQNATVGGGYTDTVTMSVNF